MTTQSSLSNIIISFINYIIVVHAASITSLCVTTQSFLSCIIISFINYMIVVHAASIASLCDHTVFFKLHYYKLH